MEYLFMKKATRILVPLVLGLFICASIVWYLFVYDRDFTRDTLLSQARFQDLHGNAQLSSWFYDLAYDFSSKEESVAIELANQYKRSGNYTKAELTLTQAISTAPTTELYTALCSLFVEQDKLLDAVNLLAGITNQDIKAEIEALRPTIPTPDYAPGYFSRYVDIQLLSSGDTIYYTTDGTTYPTTALPPYSDMITLPAGETTILAVAVGSDGLVSPLAVLNYTVTGVIEEVTFVDAEMESAIRTAIGVDADETVYTNQLWEILEFTVPESASLIVDLSLMPNLTTLTIQNKSVDSLSCLADLTNLTELDLSGSRFPSEDLAILASLPSLSRLTLNDCSLSTISDLEGANALTYLDLSNNTVRNLEALSAMSNLQELNLEHNAVTALDSLASLSRLETLNLNYNAVTDLSPLTSCVQLSWLEVGNNQLTSVSPAANLPSLTHLGVDSNELTDVSPLASCTELTYLNLSSNSISSISALSALTKLESFLFSSNQVESLPDWPDGCPLQTIDGSYNALSNIDVLKKMQSLTYVYMDYNLLTNIDALADCYRLVQVNVFGNQISDVSSLREHDIIVNYDPTVE